MKLLIIGAGEYGQLVRETAEQTGEFDTIDFLDDVNPLAVAKLSELNSVQEQYDGCVVAIGNAELRERIFAEIHHPVTVIHPRALISNTALIGRGCVIEGNASVNSSAVVGDGCFVCSGAIVNHNATAESFCQVDCNAVVGAGSILPKGTKLPACTTWNRR